MGLFRPTTQQRRIGRRRGLLVGAAIGAASSRKSAPAPQAPVQAMPQEQHHASVDIEALEQLAKLHEAGVLTDEEFAAKKKQILEM